MILCFSILNNKTRIENTHRHKMHSTDWITLLGVFPYRRGRDAERRGRVSFPCFATSHNWLHATQWAERANKWTTCRNCCEACKTHDITAIALLFSLFCLFNFFLNFFNFITGWLKWLAPHRYSLFTRLGSAVRVDHPVSVLHALRQQKKKRKK